MQSVVPSPIRHQFTERELRAGGMATVIALHPLVCPARVKGSIRMPEWLDFLFDPENVIDVVLMVIGGLLLAVITFAARLPKRAYLRVRAWWSRRGSAGELRSFIGGSPKRRDAVLRILEAANREAVGLFHSRMRGNAPTETQEKLWDKTFADAWTGQRNFVQAEVTAGPRKGELITEAATQLLEDAFPERPCRIWIRGPAGAGKSTAMLRIFFLLAEATTELRPRGFRRLQRFLTRRGKGSAAREGQRLRPIPMFVQPRNLSGDPVRRLSSPPEAGDWFQVFFEIWLENRNIPVPDWLLGPMAAELRESIEEGRVLLLLDGYDEFFRMGLDEPVRELLGLPYVIVAERSDAERGGPPDPVVLRLGRYWPSRLQREYLDRRWGTSHPEWVDLVLRTLAKPDGRWLENPRHFVFLLSVLEERDGPLTVDALRELIRGEYELLNRGFNQSLERLRAIRSHSGETLPRADVVERLSLVALAQFTGGDFSLRGADADALWSSLMEMTEVLDSEPAPDGWRLSIRHELYLEFFLARRLVAAVRGTRLPPIHEPWTPVTIATTSALLREYDADEALEGVWDCLRIPDLQSGSHALDARPRRSSTLNLVALALKLEDEVARDALIEDGEAHAITGRSLAGLDLEGASLRHRAFRGCSFDDASLIGADLQGTLFEGCWFRGTDLAHADAYGAAFRNCTFLGSSGSTPSLTVEGLQVAEAEFIDCDVRCEDLVDAGADPLHSRYREGFGRLFTSDPQWLLGVGYARLEEAYLSLIRDAVERYDSKQPVYMIDIMAGGSNQRLIRLMAPEQLAHEGAGVPGDRVDARLDNLHVLGLDRDVSQLEQIPLPESRFRAWKVDLHGDTAKDFEGNIVEGLDLRSRLAEFEGAPRHAHVLVGKKALHEVPRHLQETLIERIHEILTGDGRLILFSDSPGRMDDRGRERLEHVRQLLLQHKSARSERDVPELRAELLDEQSFGGEPEDIGLFCNLWVLLKDWVNTNDHEVQSRYFSGREEIIGWCEGGRRFRKVAEETGVYRLTPPRFNESAIRSVLDRLERDPDTVDLELSSVSRQLRGTDHPRLPLLTDFTQRHLLADNDTSTPLGDLLNVRIESTDFGDLHELLRDRNLPTVRAPVFDFPVHILAFEKVRPKERMAS